MKVIDIRKKGFSQRLPHGEFVKLYLPLLDDDKIRALGFEPNDEQKPDFASRVDKCANSCPTCAPCPLGLEPTPLVPLSNDRRSNPIFAA